VYSPEPQYATKHSFYEATNGLLPDLFLTLRINFDFKTSFSKYVLFVIKKSLCCIDAKHIFKFKIVHRFPEQNGFKHHGEYTILLRYQAVF
jgi:hypothetical protein